jgi:hypothetical protein
MEGSPLSLACSRPRSPQTGDWSDSNRAQAPDLSFSSALLADVGRAAVGSVDPQPGFPARPIAILRLKERSPHSPWPTRHGSRLTFGPWQTVYRVFRSWVKDGTWIQIHDRLREQLQAV